MKEPIKIDEPVLIVTQEQWDANKQLRDRAEMKLAQLEDESWQLDAFGGPGTAKCKDVSDRQVYIKLLKWLLGRGL